MRAELLALTAYLAMVGVTGGIYTLLQITAGESLVLAAVGLSGVMYAGAALGHVSAAAWGYMLLGLAGAICFLLRSKEKKAFFSPALAGVSLLFVGSLAAYHGAFIHNIDDFHQWAAAVKYMLENSRLPGADFIGTAAMPMFTGTFHVYFQVVGGYNEGVMYASSMLLNAVPLMLALTFTSWKEWKRCLWYILAVYLGMYHLYNHPYKSLYVDLTAAAWAACLAVWWVNRLKVNGNQGWLSNERELAGSENAETHVNGADNQHSGARRRWISLLFPVITACFSIETKWGIGLLLTGFAGLYMLIAELCYLGMEGCRVFVRKHRKGVLIAAGLLAVLLVTGVLLIEGRFIPVSLSGIREAVSFSSVKAQKTWSTLLDKIFTKKLHSKSHLQLTALPAVFAIALGVLLPAAVQKGWQKRLMIGQSIYTLVSFALYVFALYITYVSTFSYDESVSTAAVHRYLSCMVLFLFFLMMGQVVQIRIEQGKAALCTAGAVLLVFELAGLQKSFICEVSAFHYWEVSGYASIRTAKQKLAALEEAVEDTDRVYLLHQEPTLSDMDEYPMCTMLYYRSDIISNYLKVPWKFTEDGSLRMVHSADETIADLPELLAEGGYDYLWIYTTDDYLTEQLPEILEMDAQIEDGQLYRVVTDEDGTVIALELAEQL